MRETRLTGTFTATDQIGRVHVVQEWTEFIDSGTETLAGRKALKLADGTHVNRINQGQYETLDYPGRPGLKLRSSDPNAP